VQRLACSVNAAFRPRDAPARDRNAAFRLQSRRHNTALVQRLGCSVNAAFRPRDATARDRNAAFRLQSQRHTTALVQRLGCSVNAAFRPRDATARIVFESPARYAFVMSRPHQRATALTIAGSDSGGGAGIQADLHTFAACDVHGASAITCVTAQNPRRVAAIFPLPSQLVSAQIDAVFEEFPVRAVKTGMLFSSGNVRAVCRILAEHPSIPLVVDPVLRAGSGAPLLERKALPLLRRELLSRAALITPNLAEASILLEGPEPKNLEEMRAAARSLFNKFGCAVLVKGGHLRSAREAADIFYDGKIELLLSVKRVQNARTHGTGCTYSAAIAAGLARGKTLAKAVIEAKQFISAAIGEMRFSGNHGILNWFWE